MTDNDGKVTDGDFGSTGGRERTDGRRPSGGPLRFPRRFEVLEDPAAVRPGLPAGIERPLLSLVDGDRRPADVEPVNDERAPL
ncbi:hypothetical protein [Actinomadura sp. WMMB 499]|uniref:hypothetical protein n=1 Tax=Actinomadura sp. WMMB 499 TaxID=1219491 RepID=UPI001247412D|nr:hypothetical protein [Actinomadura sp. WMMB 499]QFG20101.1 hypothetical protein F7P10_01895 [Actinomadura sp. WMMB 499]